MRLNELRRLFLAEMAFDGATYSEQQLVSQLVSLRDESEKAVQEQLRVMLSVNKRLEGAKRKADLDAAPSRDAASSSNDVVVILF